MLVKLQRSECKSHSPSPDRLLGFHPKRLTHNRERGRAIYPRESRIAGQKDRRGIEPYEVVFRICVNHM